MGLESVVYSDIEELKVMLAEDKEQGYKEEEIERNEGYYDYLTEKVGSSDKGLIKEVLHANIDVIKDLDSGKYYHHLSKEILSVESYDKEKGLYTLSNGEEKIVINEEQVYDVNKYTIDALEGQNPKELTANIPTLGYANVTSLNWYIGINKETEEEIVIINDRNVFKEAQNVSAINYVDGVKALDELYTRVVKSEYLDMVTKVLTAEKVHEGGIVYALKGVDGEIVYIESPMVTVRVENNYTSEEKYSYYTNTRENVYGGVNVYPTNSIYDEETLERMQKEWTKIDGKVDIKSDGDALEGVGLKYFKDTEGLTESDYEKDFKEDALMKLKDIQDGIKILKEESKYYKGILGD